MPLIEKYMLVENIALTNPQRNTLLAAVQALGQGFMYPNPVRPDSQAGVFEARLRSGDVQQYGWKTRLGALFSVDPLTIDVFETSETYAVIPSVVYVFSRLGVDYFRVIIFGGWNATHGQSGVECSAYLVANAAAWA